MNPKKEKVPKGEKHAQKKPEQRLKELLETLQRVQAEFENYRKRAEKEKLEFEKIACSKIIREILPVLDNFDMALKNTSNHNDFVKGIEMIHSQLFSALSKEGLKPIDAEGKKFNPYVHEALMQGESDKGDGIIIEEFQKGYMIGDIVLRHSKVKVSKLKQPEKKKEVQK